MSETNPSGLGARRVWRGSVLHFLSDPGSQDAPGAYEYFEDGALVVADDRIESVGFALDLLSSLSPEVEVLDRTGCLLLPGFVDTHTHFVQTDVIASPGRQLLDWLQNYTFVEEATFADPAHARDVARFYLDELLRHGTTTAMVMGSVHAGATDAFFEEALVRNLRMVAGKVLMDRHCPENLRDTAQSGYRDTAELIERWNGRARLNVAITPRFAITSTPEQLEYAGQLARRYPDVHIQTHLAENSEEIAWVSRLFPERADYLDVYEHYGLVRPKAVFAHCIHLDLAQRRRMAEAGAAVAFCPTSNLFLGSGLYSLACSDDAGLQTSIATDIGGGTHFGMLPTLGAAYNVTQMTKNYLSPLRAFYLATLGGAKALGLEDSIGNFQAGKEADFVVLDLQATSLLARRCGRAKSLAERLFPLMTFGDDRCVLETVACGQIVHSRSDRSNVSP